MSFVVESKAGGAVGLCAALLLLVSPAFAQTTSTVVVTGAISKSKMREFESAPFWITIKNQSSAPIKSVRLAQYPDSDYSICVVRTAGGACSDLKTGDEVASHEIAAGQVFTLWGEFKPLANRSHPAQKLTVILGLNDNASFVPAVLGDNTVQDWWDHTLDSGWAKVLAVPVLLALMGFLLDRLIKRSEDRKEAREKKEEKDEAERAKVRGKLEADRAREQAVATETWKQMLPISHKYASKYYLPISSAAEDAIDAFEKPDAQAAFFHILLLLKRIDLARKYIGGLYFKSLTGEELAQRCSRTFRKTFLGEGEGPLLQGHAQPLAAGRPRMALRRFRRQTTKCAFGP